VRERPGEVKEGSTGNPEKTLSGERTGATRSIGPAKQNGKQERLFKKQTLRRASQMHFGKKREEGVKIITKEMEKRTKQKGKEERVRTAWVQYTQYAIRGGEKNSMGHRSAGGVLGWVFVCVVLGGGGGVVCPPNLGKK